jgi:hypothetical protein
LLSVTKDQVPTYACIPDKRNGLKFGTFYKNKLERIESNRYRRLSTVPLIKNSIADIKDGDGRGGWSDLQGCGRVSEHGMALAWNNSIYTVRSISFVRDPGCFGKKNQVFDTSFIEEKAI